MPALMAGLGGATKMCKRKKFVVTILPHSDCQRHILPLGVVAGHAYQLLSLTILASISTKPVAHSSAGASSSSSTFPH
jgi:hypothetical protein